MRPATTRAVAATIDRVAIEVLRKPCSKATASADAMPASAALPIPHRSAPRRVASASKGGTIAGGSVRERPGGMPGISSGSDAAPRQPRAEPIARPGEPAAHRTHRPAQLLRRHLVGQALEVAEDDDCPVFLRQPADLLMDRPGCIIIEHGVALRVFGRQRRDMAALNPFVPSRDAPRGYVRRRRLASPRRAATTPPIRAGGWSAPGPPGPGMSPGRRRQRRGDRPARTRQTRRTIGPCRATRAAKASSAASSWTSRRAANRSSSSPSPRAAGVPLRNNEVRSLAAVDGPVITDGAPRRVQIRSITQQ